MESDYETKSAHIRRLANMPSEDLIQHLSNLHPNINAVAPNMAPHIHATAANAIQFLNSKLPNAGNELMQDSKPSVPKAHQSQWLDMHNTVSDPLSVLDKVNDHSLNRHHVEALQAVYPDLHQEMVQKIQEHLGALKSKGKTLPYQQRMGVSKLIGQPLDSTMTQPNMQAVMMAAGPNTGPAAQAQNTKKASGVELKQLNKVDALSLTPQQAREQRLGKQT